MIKYIKTSIEIKASPQKVWSILTDFKKYPDWNPLINAVSGNVKVGERINVKIQHMNFKPIVLVNKRNTELKWLGCLLFKGLFDGEHKFYITDNGDGTCIFEQSEKFSGVLVGLFSKKLNNETKPSFVKMNEKLKKLAENI